MTIEPLLYLLPIIALIPCAVEDCNTRRVSGAALACLAASYIPAFLYNIANGGYNLGWLMFFAAPCICVWFILTIYGAITGRGGADRIVILLGALVPYGMPAMLMSLLVQGWLYLMFYLNKKSSRKIPYIPIYLMFAEIALLISIL